MAINLAAPMVSLIVLGPSISPAGTSPPPYHYRVLKFHIRWDFTLVITMAKEKGSLNPATAHLKSEKQKALKKGSFFLPYTFYPPGFLQSQFLR